MIRFREPNKDDQKRVQELGWDGVLEIGELWPNVKPEADYGSIIMSWRIGNAGEWEKMMGRGPKITINNWTNLHFLWSPKEQRVHISAWNRPRWAVGILEKFWRKRLTKRLQKLMLMESD